MSIILRAPIEGDTLTLLVLSRELLKTYTHDKKYAVISIVDPTDNPARLEKDLNRVAVLHTPFRDTDESNGEYRISSFHSELISKFVTTMVSMNVNFIVVQCELGISRSSGVAAALSKHFNGADSLFFKHYVPNMLVYRTILNSLEKEKANA